MTVWRVVPVAGSQIRTSPSIVGGGQPGPIRSNHQRPHPAGVAGEGVAGAPVAGSQIRTSPSSAGGGQPGPIRSHHQRRHPAGVAGEGVAGGAGDRIPDPHLPVIAGGGQPGPIRSHHQRRTPPVWPVRVWRVAPVTGSQIRTSPSSPAEASQDPSGATTNAVTLPVWTGEGVAGGAGDRIPDPHLPVQIAAAEASQDPSGATTNALTPPGVAGEGVAGGAGGRIPDPHLPVVAGGGQPGPIRGHHQCPHPVGCGR